MQVRGGFVQRVETDQPMRPDVGVVLNMPRFHPCGLGKGVEKGRAAVVIAKHEADGQGAVGQGPAQAGVFLWPQSTMRAASGWRASAWLSPWVKRA